MKRRFLPLLLSLSLLFAAFPVFSWASVTESGVIQTVRALGIMNGDGSGDLKLSSTITRAEFAKMTVSASVYKDTVSENGSGYSLFKDMKSSHWASEYVKTAVEQGWIVGYTDGTFRPDNDLTLEEACSVALKMLGYGSDSLSGSFPQAQLTKAASLGLLDGVSASGGETVTRRDCMYLFYNLLTTKTSGGQTYAETLGYTVTNGEVDYMEIIEEGLSGPYISDGSQPELSFKAETVYCDGEESALSALSLYDVYYYNSSLRSVWIYTDRITGKITALSPSASSPSSVTVSGNEYTIGTGDAAYQLSALGGTSVGDFVTLLFGMDGTVVGVLDGEEIDTVYYGVVQDSEKIVDSSDGAVIKTSVTVACTDGSVQTFTSDRNTTYSSGQLVSVSMENGSTAIRKLSEKSVSGTVNSSASKLGDLTLADGAEILDTSGEGCFVALEAERLSGCTLSKSDVRYYVLNEKGQISHLILDDVSGDTWSYGYLISAKTQPSGGMGYTVTYSYVTDGASNTLISNNVDYRVSAKSGIAMRFDGDGSVRTMRNLDSVRITELGTASVRSENRSYTLSDDVQVYLKSGSGNGYYKTSLSDLNGEDYTLTGYYDDFGCAAGGLIRIIIAEEK